jgi:hypothetical protein
LPRASDDASGHEAYAVAFPVRQSTRTSAVALKGTNHTDSPSNTQPLYGEFTPLKGGTSNAAIAAVRVLKRTTAGAEEHTIQTEVPSNAPPWNVVHDAAPLGHPLYAAIAPSLTLMRTTTLAVYGNSQIDAPSNTPLPNAAFPKPTEALT